MAFTIHDFFNLSKGKYNAGFLTLDSHQQLKMVNNHVNMRFLNFHTIDARTTLTLKNDFINALRNEGVKNETLSKVRVFLGLPADLNDDGKWSNFKLTPLSRMDVNDAIWMCKTDIDAVRGEGYMDKHFMSKTDKKFAAECEAEMNRFQHEQAAHLAQNKVYHHRQSEGLDKIEQKYNAYKEEALEVNRSTELNNAPRIKGHLDVAFNIYNTACQQGGEVRKKIANDWKMMCYMYLLLNNPGTASKAELFKEASRLAELSLKPGEKTLPQRAFMHSVAAIKWYVLNGNGDKEDFKAYAQKTSRTPERQAEIEAEQKAQAEGRTIQKPKEEKPDIKLELKVELTEEGRNAPDLIELKKLQAIPNYPKFPGLNQ